MEIDDLSDLGEEMEEEDEEPWAVTNVLHQKKDMCHEKSGRSLSPQFSVCESWKMGFKQVKIELGDATGMGIYRSSLDSRKNRTFGTQIITKLLGFVTQKNATSCIQ